MSAQISRHFNVTLFTARYAARLWMILLVIILVYNFSLSLSLSLSLSFYLSIFFFLITIYSISRNSTSLEKVSKCCSNRT